ncbi:class I SAM-dependent methyltransferase [Thiocystis violascens]|uniref:class I SAM-dependent methyltransferase n=1 Tax=Thiocystis violascens TaxID=73141 RepID=UPI0012F6E5FE|nr:class I SAM-dependent methyltransferase [Thiocystis violascens]
MAEHLAELEAWLDERFSTGGVTEDGIYFAHQPVYGFRVGPSEANWYERYLITYSIMRCLAGIEFSSLLDAGGAEGYKAALARALFGCAVTSGDLSHQACLRARELYGIDSQRVDLHALPHDDESWDVVLASETLEHVFDHRRVIDELLRVARSAVVITVPHESPEHVAMTVKANEIHGHIHYFDTESFDAWRERGIEVVCEKILATSNWTALPGQLMECVPEVVASSGSRIVRTLGRHPGLARALFGKRLTGSLLERDPRLAARPGAPYRGVLAVLYKDPSARRTKPSRRVRMRDILDFRTPRIRPNLDGLPPRRFGP